MTPEERKEAERKKAAHRASKGIVEGADAPVEIEPTLPVADVVVKYRRGRKAK